LRVCVYMTARSWTNVWHTTFTKYTQMSYYNVTVVRTYSHVSCAEALFAYILIAITRKLSGNRSQTPISSYKNTPHVWACGSNIPPTCVFWNLDDTHPSQSAQCWQIIFARRYALQQPTGEQKRIVPTCVQVCVSMLWRAAANLYIQWRLPSTSLRNPPSITTIRVCSPVVEAKFLLGLVGACSRASVPLVAHILKWAAAIALFVIFQ